MINGLAERSLTDFSAMQRKTKLKFYNYIHLSDSK